MFGDIDFGKEGAVSLSLSARGEQGLVRSNGRQAAVAISIFSGSLVGGHPANSAIALSGLCARSVCQLSGALGVCFDVTRSGSLSSAGCGSTADCGGSSSGVAASATGSVAVFPARRGKRRSPIRAATRGTVGVPALHASGLSVSATSSPQNELESAFWAGASGCGVGAVHNTAVVSVAACRPYFSHHAGSAGGACSAFVCFDSGRH